MMKNIAIIPARSGSKGLPGKNIKLLNGKPLLGYSIDAAKKSEMFDEIMVSTDSEEYADIARNQGVVVPFLRSEKMSNDTAGSWDAVIEVLENYKKIGKMFDTVCLLQPTSPLRDAEDIIGAYKFFNEMFADAVTSVCEVAHSPLWCTILPQNKSLKEFRRKLVAVPRQQLDKYYQINGGIYIRKIEYSNDGIRLLEEKEYAYIMERSHSIDIDCMQDFMYAEYLVQKT